MKFSRLRLLGFKSFCDQTELVMEPGLTGIVGPNGCGKSNLVEAMRWAMGESSYKAMRASGMDDVIFSGSGNRPGRNSAEVTLVLDNSDRTAPAVLNNADILEVTRRIEREAGSVYRVNGKEVRARDVQLLFADASTGAHSPAMVRQGQIGELIAAKPVQRRALLEEAAGISGLHSRRHEAELRLRGAEQNLERVDDIIGQIETQLESLKRQARLALRYRSLSGDIRRSEATLFHIRWVAARFAEKETEAQQGVLIRDLADATHLELQAQKKLDASQAALQPLREREAATGAALQRLKILSEQLVEEARRASQRQAELTERLHQFSADSQRERDLLAESEANLTGYGEELATLEDEGEAAQAAFDAARAEAETARITAQEIESATRHAAEAVAQIKARRAQATRAAEDAQARVARVRQQIDEVEQQTTDINRRLSQDETLLDRRAALEAAQLAAEEAESQTLVAEATTTEAQAALDTARPKLMQIEAGLNRLEAEATTLNKMLNSGTRQWSAIVDDLQVEPGYETALGAALGDDLEASADNDAPIYWADGLDGSDDPALPQGAEPLARHVSGNGKLNRRLAQIGLVDQADGPGLMRALRAGQLLVTMDGNIWRWDGLVAAADAPSAATMRLAQRNRLTELDEEIVRARGEQQAWQRDLAALGDAVEAARRGEKAWRDSWRGAQHGIGAAQTEVDKAQRAVSELTTQKGALEDARTRLGATLTEAEAAQVTVETALADGSEEAEAAETLAVQETTLTQARERAEMARAKLAGFESAAQMRQSRTMQLIRDQTAWQRRCEGARAQLNTLEARAREVEVQLEAATAAPAGYDDRASALTAQIDDATIAHKAATDSFSYAQSGHHAAEKDLRQASEILIAARVELVRIEERLKAAIVQRQQIERLALETLGIEASRTLEASGIRPEAPLPAESAVEHKLERLKAERERLGGVNLTAEREAEEVGTRLMTMTKDRDDLIEAIAKLRLGIQSLNREGRARLSEAFDRVNDFFQELFTNLFGGGTAELKFVESEDPLEAGLEIIACPPGKKPQTMTLLSGGEQALTAMSLIFAVFLTNPAPICVLDEVDAPLDDANVERFCNLLDLDAPAHQHPLYDHHPQPDHHGPNGSPVRRHHGRARGEPTGIGRSGNSRIFS
ncbi:chromosome segregation SMC family protein [Devosia rhodophyticola]|uniref:chromosome segregation SMC family protein n=1 Tax=Devosia rhodophyticola TaxID=3026423 RepID=UPI0038996BD4